MQFLLEKMQLENQKELPYLTVDFDQWNEIESMTRYQDYTRLTFMEKLLKADADVQEKYNTLKNELLRYPICASMAKDGESFYYKKKMLAKMKIIGKTLRLYVALNPDDYAESPIPTQDASEKKAYQKVPLMMKVKSNLSLKRAKLLISHTMENN